MINLTKGKLVLEGPRKKLYHSNEPGIFVMQFKDEEKSLIDLSEQRYVDGSGTVNNAISAFIMSSIQARKSSARNSVQEPEERNLRNASNEVR